MPKRWTDADTEFWTAPTDDPPELCCVCGKLAEASVLNSRMIRIGMKPRLVCDTHTAEDAEWAMGGHPWRCACGACDMTGDKRGTVKTLGVLRPMEKEDLS